MAYARGLLRVMPDYLAFGAVLPHGGYRRLPKAAALRLLDQTEDRWRRSGHISRAETRRFALSTLAALYRPSWKLPERRGPRIFVKTSPNALHRPALISAILRREQARMVCMVHDMIPIEFPEYARPDGARRHAVRIRTIVDHAAGIIANSQATLNSLLPWMAGDHSRVATSVAHLGTEFIGCHDVDCAASDRPYFVCIATIEPRKNHLLLLNIWRRLVEEHGDRTPRLLLVGRRGWENEQVLDMIERCPALQGHVEERGRMADEDIPPLLRGARALLLPSFAEGYGMPVSEALALRVPVLCSDLPAWRYCGPGVP